MENLFTYVKKQDEDRLLEDLFLAYFDARKNKRNKKASLEYELNFESNLINLHKAIIKRTYETKPCTAFLVKKPVLREVFAASFSDRVVHHYIYNQISPIFEKEFIDDSYSCRKNKGTLYGIDRAFDFIKKCSDDYTRNCYILKLDIRGYFYSINKNLLYKIIFKTLDKSRNSLKCDFETLDFLIKKTIFSHPKKDVNKFPDKEWKILPKSKSLFYAKKDCGLPIGNFSRYQGLLGNTYNTKKIYV